MHIRMTDRQHEAVRAAALAVPCSMQGFIWKCVKATLKAGHFLDEDEDEGQTENG